MIGRVYIVAGNRQEARSYQRHLRKLDPSFDTKVLGSPENAYGIRAGDEAHLHLVGMYQSRHDWPLFAGVLSSCGFEIPDSARPASDASVSCLEEAADTAATDCDPED